MDQRETAQGIVRYRRLTELLFALKFSVYDLCSATASFHQLLECNGIVQILDAREFGRIRGRGLPPRSFFIKRDGTFYEVRIPIDIISTFESEWESFKSIKQKSKEIILEALREMYRPSILVRYCEEQFESYLHERTMMQPTDPEDE